MSNLSLHERIDNFIDMGGHLPEFPKSVIDNLNPLLPLRPYQEEALRYLLYYLDYYPNRVKPTQLLFHMATGSGKTLIMAAALLYLYQLGYRNFIFFVDSTTIIEKTRDNFLNPISSKYLFASNIKLDGNRVPLQSVESFQAVSPDAINILFTTIQGLHSTLNNPRENALTYLDFEGNPLVLLSDEAHHINALTKSSRQRNVGETENINTWEATINRIFQSDPRNLLLEFTATAELTHPAVADKYQDKIIYDYTLKQFREDGYSKEVRTLQADMPRMQRALQAIVVSQYRKKVAERHGIGLKPVVLMKANYVNPPSKADPNKVVSEEFRSDFHHKISTLSLKDLLSIRDTSQAPIVQRAFKYFDGNDISLENLIYELKDDFSQDKAISIDSKSDNEQHQILVNTLEAPGNEIRIVFAVEMLNEGWDVLNLFDIVRLYNTRDAKSGIPGRTTISEAQLIGRGARYFPFQLNDSQPRFQRKFDDDEENDLRALEVLYYHSAHNPRYIQELHSALVDIGMLPERPVRQLHLNLKDSFKSSDFWKQGLLFTNDRVRNENNDVFDLVAPTQGRLNTPHYKFHLRTGYAEESALLEPQALPQYADTETQNVYIRDFGPHLLRAALSRIKFFEFRNLRHYFPNVESISDFITSDAYISQVSVDITGTASQLQSLSSEAKLEISVNVLQQLADDLQSETPEFRGTYEFKPHGIRNIVKDKTISREYNALSDVGTGMKETTNLELHADLSTADWYVYDENYGTSEEKALVKFIQGQIPILRQKFDEIYLLRNEKLFKLYQFEDGLTFEPDFVLFLTERETGDMVNYQLFIEPKGDFLVSNDQWKEVADMVRPILAMLDKEWPGLMPIPHDGIPWKKRVDAEEIKT